MRIVVRLICLAYVSLLTVLLLAPDPGAAVGLKKVPWFPLGDIGIHFCAFCLLALLVYSTRWPKPLRWLWIVVLLGYGFATETLQAYVPFRTVELKDYFDNSLGIAAGSGLYWLLLRIWQVWIQKKKQSTQPEYELT